MAHFVKSDAEINHAVNAVVSIYWSLIPENEIDTCMVWSEAESKGGTLGSF